MLLNQLTILIPTRERSDTLYHTIRTCLNQTYQNLQVIISDNFSQDNTREVVLSFNDPRVHYVNTGSRMSMSENFDFALSHVWEGYVMFIGDDDGLLPNSLEYVNEIINRTGSEAVVSLNALYTWPNTKTENRLIWSPKSGYEVRYSKEWIRKYLTFQLLYTFDLPGAYCGFVKRDVLTRITKDKKFFRSSTPDAYSALAIAFATKFFIFSHTPFVVHGSSARSNGGSYLSTAKQEEGEESKLFFKENTIQFHPAIVMTKSFRVSSLEAFLQFSETFPELTRDFSVDWKAFLRFVLTERTENTKEEIEEAVREMCSMHKVNYIEILSSVPSKFTGISVSEIISKAINKLGRLFNKRTYSVDDTTKYGVYNVYDATLLLNFFIKER